MWLLLFCIPPELVEGFPDGSDCKESACKAEDLGSILGYGRSPGEGNGNPLQYSCLENPMDRGAWWATIHGATNSWTQLSDFHSLSSWKIMGHIFPSHYILWILTTGLRVIESMGCRQRIRFTCETLCSSPEVGQYV